MATLERLGWRTSHQVWFSANASGIPARVSAVYGATIAVLGLDPTDPQQAQLIPLTLRSDDGLATPCVGDWISCQRTQAGWSVRELFPRSSCFVRKVKGRGSAAQLIAANVDRVFVVTAVGGDLSVRRIERYLAQIWASGAEPVIVINKVDRAHDAGELMREVESVAVGAPIVRISALTSEGLSELRPWLSRDSTIAVVGSSGVGKSTLVNRLLGEQRLATSPIREHDETGVHTTTHRELVLAPDGFLLIDTPGMRELGLIDAEDGLEAAFPEIGELTTRCRFSDCQHSREPGCALRDAIARGLLPEARLASYQALRDELEHNQQRAAERNNIADKQRWKSMNKAHREQRKLHHKLGLKGD